MVRNRARVTTVVPTFQRPSLLQRALESVAMQTFGDFRVRVYDNASGDETADVVRAWTVRDLRFEYHAHKQNLGSERNFRFGLDQVDTEYFSFLSDDDVLLPNLYERTLNALDAHPDAAMASTGVVHVNAAGAFLREPSLEARVHQPPEGLVEMLRLNQPAWTGTLFRTEMVRQAGGIDVDSVIDLDLELRIASRYAIVVLEGPGAILTTEHHFAKCLAWPSRFELTIRKMEDDQRLSPEIRALVRPSLERRLHMMVFQTGVVGARMGRSEVAREAARVLLAEFGDWRRSFILTAMARAARFVPTIAPAYKRVRGTLKRSAAPTPSERLRQQLRELAPGLIDRLSETSAA